MPDSEKKDKKNESALYNLESYDFDQNYFDFYDQSLDLTSFNNIDQYANFDSYESEFASINEYYTDSISHFLEKIVKFH